MILTIIGVILLIFSFPFTAIALGFKTIQATNKVRLKSLKGKKEKGKGNSLINKIKSKLPKGNKKKSKNEQKIDNQIKLTKASNVALKASQITAKAVANTLRGISSVCSILAPLELYLVVLVLILLIVSAIACVLLVNNDYIDLSGSTSSNNSLSSNENGFGQQQEVIVDDDNSTWVNAYTTMWKWYCSNVNTYQHGINLIWDSAGNAVCNEYLSCLNSCGIRHGYSCNLLSGALVGDDCSAYVGACIDYLGLNYSSNAAMNMSSSNVANFVGDSFEAYTSSSPNFEAKEGDILCFSGHVEILAHIEDEKFYVYSWGRVPDCVINNTEATWAARGNLSDIFNSNNYMGRPVLTVYRYKGGN